PPPAACWLSRPRIAARFRKQVGPFAQAAPPIHRASFYRRCVMKRLAIVIGSTLLVAFTAEISSAFTADLPSAYVLCKAHKAGRDGSLVLRKNQCRKREVRINPADYPEFMGPQGVEG